MGSESSFSRFGQAVVRGRTLIFLAVADVILFLIANVAYGAGHQHGLRNAVSNVTWVLFLVGVLSLIVLAVIALGTIGVAACEGPGVGGSLPMRPGGRAVLQQDSLEVVQVRAGSRRGSSAGR